MIYRWGDMIYLLRKYGGMEESMVLIVLVSFLGGFTGGYEQTADGAA